MQATQEPTIPVVRSAWPESGLMRHAFVVLAGSALLAACAWIRVPMWPVPMTMQTFAVLLIGATCGPRLGAAAVAAYLAEAALGLPVLAGGTPPAPAPAADKARRRLAASLPSAGEALSRP